MRAILIALLFAPLAVTQQSAPVVAKKTAKFDVTTQLVVVNVAVKTKSGDPIDNMKTSDFTVTEDGKPQEIKIFEFQRLGGDSLPPPVLAQRQEEPSAVKPLVAAAIAPAKPGEIKYRDRRLLVFFFDQAGMPVADQLRAQQSALKFLNSQITQ
jgi:VWFA-related protein